MKKKFKVGDRVRLDDGIIGQITSNPSEGCYFVNGYIMCTDAHIKEVVDKKTAFLTKLKELMERYEAKIAISWNRPIDDDCPTIYIDGKPLYYTEDKEITPSNIFDYDK